MKKLIISGAIGVALLSQASTMYVLPSDTLLSGNSAWVSFDAAYADFIFTAKESIDSKTLSVTAPNGKKAELHGLTEGKVRSTFEVELTEEGTYAATSFRKYYYVKYSKDGEKKLKKWRGSKAEFEEKIKDKAFADSIKQVRNYTLRADTFVSLGEPSDNGLKAEDLGFDFDFITHPNNYVVGEKAEFILKKNGKPVPNAVIKVERGGARFNPSRDLTRVTTDENGHFSVTWKKQGQYVLSIKYRAEKPKDKLKPQERTRYFATVEVFGD